MSVRDEVIGQIAEMIRLAEDRGLKGIPAARAAFPGTPEGVLIQAAIEADARREEEWWQSIEKTIDGEIIKAALVRVGGAR